MSNESESSQTVHSALSTQHSVLACDEIARVLPDALPALQRRVGRPIVVKLGGSVGPGETVLQEVA